MAEESDPLVVVAWSPIWVTLGYSILQGLVLFVFFQLNRNKDIDRTNYDLFEPRQHTRSHRSPPPFDGGKGLFNWAVAAWNVDDDTCLKYVGLDAYMFLRFLRLSARMTLLGSVLSMTLLPVYATGEARGASSEQFNRLTLARVGQGSPRLWATLLCWYIFCAFILVDLWREWTLYAKHRYAFLATGDVDTPHEYRYTLRVENIPPNMRSNAALRRYFERLFPNQVRQVSVCLYATRLDSLIAERKNAILGFEKAVAFSKAKPDKPAPTIRRGANLGCCGGTVVDAIPYYKKEIDRLNIEIDKERSGLFALADLQVIDYGTTLEQHPDAEDEAQTVEHIQESDPRMTVRQILRSTGKDAIPQVSGTPSSTGYVTFTSLRAKQAALQSEISGQKDCMETVNAADPASVIWENVTTPLIHQDVLTLAATCVWFVLLLFWSVPVACVTSIANLNGILEAVGAPPANPNSLWYGVVAGILPVVFLQLLMLAIYIAIAVMAKKVIRKKSMAEVDAYIFLWNQLFQFAKLWMILIGNSLFNQIQGFFEGNTQIFRVIADAVPGGSVFFLNMINMGSFGFFGLELSMLETYGMELIVRLIQPEEQRTQRMLDDARSPRTIKWGAMVPRYVFVYFVAIMYMPIVPLVELFALIYFGGAYVVWKHQCLHVYTNQFEGGGSTTWERLFNFLMGAIYTSEGVFIAYMGIKNGPLQAGFGFIPAIVTIMVHFLLARNIQRTMRHLSLEVAANIDETEGEQPMNHISGTNFADIIEKHPYGQPSLKLSQDEREPLPYRRDKIEEVEVTPADEEEHFDNQARSNEVNASSMFNLDNSFIE